MASISLGRSVAAQSLVHEGTDLCGELVRRGGRALTIPFGGRKVVISFQMIGRRRRAEPGISPELSDGELARIASQDTTYRPAWERSLALQYGGTSRL